MALPENYAIVDTPKTSDANVWIVDIDGEKMVVDEADVAGMPDFDEKLMEWERLQKKRKRELDRPPSDWKMSVHEEVSYETERGAWEHGKVVKITRKGWLKVAVQDVHGVLHYWLKWDNENINWRRARPITHAPPTHENIKLLGSLTGKRELDLNSSESSQAGEIEAAVNTAGCEVVMLTNVTPTAPAVEYDEDEPLINRLKKRRGL